MYIDTHNHGSFGSVGVVADIENVQTLDWGERVVKQWRSCESSLELDCSYNIIGLFSSLYPSEFAIAFLRTNLSLYRLVYLVFYA